MKKNIFIIFVSTVILFLVCEIIFNLINLRPANNNYGWQNAHNTYSKFIKNINLNEFGFRDVNKDKRYKNRSNIILLGDSQIELAQPAENMPARILENNLKEQFNVYSFGSWGWGNDQQLLILRKTIKKLKPKYVILFFTLNDLENNLNNIGFKGEKPTFKIDNNFKVSEPKFQFFKSILNKLWSYRVLYRLKLKYEKKNYKKFTEEKNFLRRENCRNEKTYSKREIFNFYSNYNYLRNKYLETSTARNQKIKKEERFKKDITKFFVTRNVYKPEEDKLFYFRDIKTFNEKKQIYLTNYLINQIQKTSKENYAKFIVLNVINENNLFINNEQYKVCVNNKIVKYSNLYLYELFKQIFYNIDNLVEYNILAGTKEYDLIDGHLNFIQNKKIFEKVANKILEFEKK